MTNSVFIDKHENTIQLITKHMVTKNPSLIPVFCPLKCIMILFAINSFVSRQGIAWGINT
jgi:hypothetical protein